MRIIAAGVIAEFEFEEETMMIAIIGASTFSVVIILSVLLICGLPLGELTMGGRYKVFPKKLRIVFSASVSTANVFCNHNFANGRDRSFMVFPEYNKNNLCYYGGISFVKYRYELYFKK